MDDKGYRADVRNAEGPVLPVAIREFAESSDAVFRFLQPDGSERVHDYPSIWEEVCRRGQNLRDLGLDRGDRVAFVVPDYEEFVLSFLAALAAGVVPVPMYPPLSFGKLDAYVSASAGIIEASGARMILTDRKVQSILWSLVDRVDSVESLHTVDELHEPVEATFDVEDVSPDDVAFLQYTSGSTAKPKGVIVTHRSLLANMNGIMNEGLRIRPDDVAVSWLPLYHDMGLIGMMLCPVWYGVPSVYIPTVEFVKHPSLWMKAMSKYKGTLSFAPNFAYALSARRTRESTLAELDLSHVRVLGCGAEPNHPGTLQAFLDHFAPAGLPAEALLPCYGMAEATLAITFVGLGERMKVDRVEAESYQDDGVATPADADDEHALDYVSCGRPFENHEVVILDDDGNELGERRVGEIYVRGPSVTAGYFGEPERTAETFTNAGLRTGDLGYVADGELYVTGRKKDLIILNGRNYDPQSIEWVAQEVPGVRKGNVVAFSRPGERTEELVVVAEIKQDVDEAELTRQISRVVREELAVSPADVVLVGRGALPKTSSGKLQRAKTRQQYLDGELGTEGVRTVGAQGHKLTLAKHLARSAVSQVRHTVKDRASSVIRRITPQFK